MMRLFIPERIGSYYLMSQRIVGIDIRQNRIIATVLKAQGTKRIIEAIHEIPFENEHGEERIIQALKKLPQTLERFNSIQCALPSSLAVVKELTLPMMSRAKVSLVVPFEVETLLPFPLHQAALDSIITHTNEQTHILVAAVQLDIIERYTNYFTQAGLPLDKLTIDIFELYGLYRQRAPEEQCTTALIDLGYHTTDIALIVDGQLRSMRTLPNGLIAVAKQLNKEASTNEAVKDLMLIDSQEQVQQAFTALTADITFTVDAYLKKLKIEQPLKKLVITGPAVDITNLDKALSAQLGLAVELFKVKDVIRGGLCTSKVNHLSNSALVSIATALPNPVTQDFTLLQAQQQEKDERLFKKQFIALSVLLCLLFGSFIIYSFLRVRSLKGSVTIAQKEAITALQGSFKLKAAQTVSLEAANKAASNELKVQQKAWDRLSEENRSSYLRSLMELSRCINAKELQLELTRLTMKDDSIKLYGSVPGYQQLTKLQAQLECPHFKKLSKLQDWNFKSEPITLTVQKEDR